MKILAVCGLGQGSSLILRMTIEEALKELNIEAEVDHMDVGIAQNERANYIMTNQELADSMKETKAKVLIVKNYFDKNEIIEVLKKELQ